MRPNHGSSLAIRNGLLIDPAERLEGKYDLLLKDGRVTEVAPAGKLRGKADETFNARGLPADLLPSAPCPIPAR